MIQNEKYFLKVSHVEAFHNIIFTWEVSMKLKCSVENVNFLARKKKGGGGDNKET